MNDISFTGAPRTSEASAYSNRSNDNLFIFGGIIQYNPYIVKYDTSYKMWTKITTESESPNFDTISCAKFNNGLIAILDEKSELWMFDSLELTFSLSNASNVPEYYLAYCATISYEETILCIGRDLDRVYVLMNKVSVEF
ncbi:hypothetical protein F8M41_008108 [Gigaspora margarita]|uniref:Uncharacterized protein n=1 Tax=Gigaspora margarita TaxID=4874 RepID=A0A8H4A2V1_GIGMA|nr:hypothetical protein F8M41_008108 [Gigaspora margarita]